MKLFHINAKFVSISVQKYFIYLQGEQTTYFPMHSKHMCTIIQSVYHFFKCNM